MVVSVTGELIGVEYLYQQTNQVLEDVSLDPDAPDEAAAVDTIDDDDEGIVADEEDPTVFVPDAPAAAQSGNPADAPRSEPSVPTAPPPEAPEGQPVSSDPEVSSLIQFNNNNNNNRIILVF